MHSAIIFELQQCLTFYIVESESNNALSLYVFMYIMYLRPTYMYVIHFVH